MTSAWFLGARAPVEQDQTSARSMIEPIRTDPQNSEMQHAPEYNTVETDNSGALVGLSPRGKSGDVHEPIKFSAWWAKQASVLANVVTDSQVSTSGITAAREETTSQGHGTIHYVDSIEPIIREGNSLGNDYFVRNDRVIQDGAGEYMEPTADHWTNIVAARRAQRNSRYAGLSSEFARAGLS